MDGLIIDNFAGGGGASLGVEMACWKSPDIAINHSEIALSLHAANHPNTEHIVEDVWNVDPRAVTKGRPVAVAWFSPDCKHFSKAKGGKPVEKKIRGLAWVIIRWAVSVRPAIIALENVEEFQDWGPLNSDGMPCPLNKGRTFRLFVQRLRQAGYDVEWRELRACDYGAPTIRKRLFMIARCDGRPIRWPEPTHGDPKSLEVAVGALQPWRTAAECIDWSIPCPSIFGRERPLAEKTMARIARGVKRFVIDAQRPFIVNLTHGGRCEDIDEPFKTLTGAHRGEKALVTPFIAGVGGRMGQSPERSADVPFQTLTAKADSVVVAPFFIPRHGEHATQEPRCRSVEDPLPTVDASASGASLVASFMAQHNTDMVGHPMDAPVSTIVGKGCTQALTTAFLTKFYGTNIGQDVRLPFPTVTADGQHVGAVRAFLLKYYGTGGQLSSPAEPMHTLTDKARMGLVTVAGVEYQIVDIGMRMLTPRELFRAQGFPDSYIIDQAADGTPITKTDQIRLCGNSVCPPLARAIIQANFGNQAVREAKKRRAVA
ncbi:MAG: DNA cytosine methyltransferase [Vicinamibacterales bacterium]